MHNSIEHQLAIAMVRGGLSYNSFCLLTLSEWEAVAREISDEQDVSLRNQWEQTRQLIYAALVPHLREGTTVRALVPLPWDEEGTESKPIASTPPTQEEIQAMLQRFGADT